MKKIFFLFLVCMFCTGAFSQNLQWAKSLNADGLYDQGTAVAIDAAGNVYTTGLFQGTMDFDPGPATFNVTSAAATPDACDIFITKLDAAGNFVWAKTIGGLSYQRSSGRAIAVDATGNIYVTGIFWGTADFDPGTGIYNLTANGGASACFVLKLDASGNFLWAAATSGSSCNGFSIAMDAAGNCYVTGQFKGTVDFDPGPAIYELTVSPPASEIYACFILKLNSLGNFIWVKSTFGNNQCYSNSITLDEVGNIYVTGGYSGKYDFDPGPLTYNLTSTSIATDAFILKLDNLGNFLWVRAFEGTDNKNITNMVINASGNLFVTGDFHETVDFDPGPGIYNLSAVGVGDIFISKFDSEGDFIWAKSIGSTGTDASQGMAVDSFNNIYTCGAFSETVDFDPGPATHNLNAAGDMDIFILKLDSSGNFLNAQSFGSTDSDVGISIKTDPANNIYMTGNFSNVVDFDPGSGIYNLISTGGRDVFILKLNQPLVPITLLNFDVTKNKNNAFLTWKTAIEFNTAKFEIERSEDGNSFRKIGEVNAFGNSNTIKVYHFIDRNAGINFPGKNIYYRFKQMDPDGKYTFSPVRSVKFETNIAISIYPNPANDIITIDANILQVGLNYSISDETGRLMMIGKLNNTGTVVNIKQLPKGIYFVTVDKQKKAIKLIRQ